MPRSPWESSTGRANIPSGSQLAPFQTPAFRIAPINGATDNGRALDPQETASRGFLGVVFVVLLFMSVIIYGMWVASGVAAEKSSRVMELMISAASPRQMLTGKVVGIGAAGLTQYLAIAVPALVVLAFQDRIAEAVLGPGWSEGAPIVGLTPALLAGYGVFFLLGFGLFALIYAAMGAFVSRPDDLQTLSLPLSLVAIVGYLTAILALEAVAAPWIRAASFVPPFSPFVMLARIMVTAVQPWEVALSLGLLVVAVAAVAVVATRMYAAGVLLYGQRPGRPRVHRRGAAGGLARPLRPTVSLGTGIAGRRPDRVALARYLPAGAGLPDDRHQSSNGRRRIRARTGAVGTADGRGRPTPSVLWLAATGAPAATYRHSRLRTPGRYGLDRWRARIPAIPWATAAS